MKEGMATLLYAVSLLMFLFSFSSGHVTQGTWELDPQRSRHNGELTRQRQESKMLDPIP
jgi:hypothetical protein